MKHFWVFSGIMSMVFILAGCAPAPPPPLLGGPGILGIGWIVLGFIAFAVLVVWKKSYDKTSEKTNYITNALNDINERLRKLEEKVEKIEKQNSYR